MALRQKVKEMIDFIPENVLEYILKIILGGEKWVELNMILKRKERKR